MRELINIVTDTPIRLGDLIEEADKTVRANWYVLLWDGSDWKWSEAMSKEQASLEYERQIMHLPEHAAKLICLSTVREQGDPAALNTPLR